MQRSCRVARLLCYGLQFRITSLSGARHGNWGGRLGSRWRCPRPRPSPRTGLPCGEGHSRTEGRHKKTSCLEHKRGGRDRPARRFSFFLMYTIGLKERRPFVTRRQSMWHKRVKTYIRVVGEHAFVFAAAWRNHQAPVRCSLARFP